MRIVAWLGSVAAVAGLLVTPAVTTSAGASASTAGATVTNVCGPTAPGYAQCMAEELVPAPGTATPASSTPRGYSPRDLASAYGLDSAKGAGQTIAVVDAYDDPTAAADLAVYRAQYNLPPCTVASGCFTKVGEDGTSTLPTSDTSWSGEITLDLDMVSAICPLCNILLVEADDASFDDLGTAVDTAVAMGAKYVSNSYGAGEWSSESYFDRYYKHPGVAITVSTGDDGYGATYPATSPYVTAVGGTSLSKASGARGWVESAWSGANSGCSAYEPRPSWQSSVATGCTMRAAADVSAVADPYTGVAVYGTTGMNGWSVYGGTSAAAPIIAGVYALAGTPGSSDYPNSYPYAHAANLYDVVSGSNGSCTTSVLCTAGTGWDGPTGLGTPNGSSAFGSAATTAPTVGSLNVNVGVVGQTTTPTVCSGTSVTVQATVTDAATGVPVAGVPVTLTDKTSDGTTWTIARVTSNNQGIATATLAPTSAVTLGAAAAATPTYAAASAAGVPLAVTTCTVSLTGAADQTSVAYRGAVNVAGTLLRTGAGSPTPIVGSRVQVLDTPTGGRARVLATATVASNGAYAARIQPTQSGELSVVYTASRQSPVSTDVGPIAVANWLTHVRLRTNAGLTAGVRRAVAGQLTRTYGARTVAAPNLTVRLFLTSRTGHRKVLASVRTDSAGQFRATVLPSSAGSLTAVLVPVAGYSSSSSSPLVIAAARHTRG